MCAVHKIANQILLITLFAKIEQSTVPDRPFMQILFRRDSRIRVCRVNDALGMNETNAFEKYVTANTRHSRGLPRGQFRALAGGLDLPDRLQKGYKDRQPRIADCCRSRSGFW